MLDTQHNLNWNPDSLFQRLGEFDPRLLQCSEHIDGTAIEEIREVYVRSLEYASQRIVNGS